MSPCSLSLSRAWHRGDRAPPMTNGVRSGHAAVNALCLYCCEQCMLTAAKGGVEVTVGKQAYFLPNMIHMNRWRTRSYT